ncbi:MAG TPA: nucleotidyltransferase family protein [Steroidobacteraceae bacterium]|nr:nucleotidyltransferase family protein [Steroidobacteraceae bacterium]
MPGDGYSDAGDALGFNCIAALGNVPHHPTMQSVPHILVLAAGASRRLGQPKQLVKIGGRPLLHRVVANAVSVAGHAVTVVIGAHTNELTHLLAHSPASRVINREWEEGIGSSIRRGMASLPASCEAVMVLLGDQFGITTEDLRRLVSAWNGEPGVIAASTYDQHLGVPAIFPHVFFSELAVLSGDAGARRFIERNRYRVTRVAMPNGALDLDTPEDLMRLQRNPGDNDNHP